MGRNYKAINYIRKELNNLDDRFVDCVVRCFNCVDTKKEPNGCMSNTVALYICAKEYGYNPTICYGLCQIDDKKFYHAWLELDNTIIDIAIYGNINYSIFSMWDKKVDTPYIGGYKESYIRYGKFEFDEDWKYSLISSVKGLELIKYMDKAPQNAMWKLVYKYLDKTFTNESFKRLRLYINDVVL